MPRLQALRGNDEQVRAFPSERDGRSRNEALALEDDTLPREFELTAKIEPFDSFWEAPEDIEKGYSVVLSIL